MSGFDPLRHDWWPGIAAALPDEWPREAAMMDLRWWAAEVRVFQRSFPSRPKLMRRWGWTERRVRSLLAATDQWQDPLFPMTVDSLRRPSTCTTRRPPGAGCVGDVPHASCLGPAEGRSASGRTREKPDDPEKVPGGGPVAVRGVSRDGPHARPFTGTSTTTRTRISSPTAGAGQHLPSSDVPSGAASTAPPTQRSKDTVSRRMSPESSAYPAAIEAWDQEYHAAFGVAYPWVFKGRDGDGARVNAWIDGARVGVDEFAPGMARLRGAIKAYFQAVKAGTSWPAGEPAQTRHFTRELARWLQVDPALASRATSTGASPRARVASIVELLERRNASAPPSNPHPDRCHVDP